MKIFIAGPRSEKILNDDIKNKLFNIAEKHFDILIGDASGIDKSVQKYYKSINYSHVRVYISGNNIRNNIGLWPVYKIIPSDNIKGFDFYALKDKKMAEDADYGFMIWNGKSKGTLNNIINLIYLDKKLSLYFIPHKKFYGISTLNEMRKIILLCEPDIQRLYVNLLSQKNENG